MKTTKKTVIGVVSLGFSLVVSALVVSQPSPPTYYRHVANILEQHCTSCHTHGGIAPFSLEDAAMAVRMAPAIKYVVENNIMPPWPPGPNSLPMLEERKLTPEERATLIAWVEAGAPLGNPQDRPPSTQQPKPPQPQPDRVLTINPPYRPNKNLTDDYRCFLLNPKLEADTFVTGYRIKPQQAKMVHHVILFVIGPEAVAEAQARDRAEEGSGWTCFGGPGVGGINAALGGMLGFWVPGTSGTDFPKGTGRLLRAGSHIVIQVHYYTTYGDGEDATGVELHLGAPQQQYAPILGMVLAAPVEVRCPGPYPSDANDPCNRDYALRRALPDFALAADGLHTLCGTRPEDYIKRNIGDGSAQEMRCDWRVRQNGLALGIAAHMHLRGKSFRIELNPDTPEAKVLLDIPRWDFNWQGQYWFREPLTLKNGDRVRITCFYNNSQAIPGPDRRPLPPRYMIWGEGTYDEMCLGGIAYIRS